MPEEQPIFTGEMATPKNRSAIIPVLITAGCAVLLTGGFIYGFAATCNFNGPTGKLNTAFFWLSVAGLLVILVCFVSIAILGILEIVRKIREG